MRDCKNKVFSYVGFGTVLGTIFEFILEPKMDPKSHCDSLWAPSVAILTLFWGVEKVMKKSVEKSCAGIFKARQDGSLWSP